MHDEVRKVKPVATTQDGLEEKGPQVGLPPWEVGGEIGEDTG